MAEVGLVLLGAALSLLAAFVTERWKFNVASRTAALLLVRELDLHKSRLDVVSMVDRLGGEYEMKFPSPIWEAHSTSVLTGAPWQDADAVLRWYGTMSVLGNALSRRIGPDGQANLSGPERSRLEAALKDATDAAERLASRSIFLTRKHKLSPSLFEPQGPVDTGQEPGAEGADSPFRN